MEMVKLANGNDAEQKIGRQSADFHPSIWGDYFITLPSLTSQHQESEAWMKQRVEELIMEVKETLIRDLAKDPLSEMHLVDALQRLGVGYHFENEMDQVLSKIHTSDHHTINNDLHQAALRFRLLRQHRYNVPSADVFERFKDEEGAFKSELGSDVKGLLSLYQAAYLGTRSDPVLDEARSFAKTHLESMAEHDDLEPHLASLVQHELKTPLHRRMRRLEARLYISIYEQEARNDAVLEIAKLDFHLLQLLHRQEIHTLSMWWEELGLSTKLTFARDRMVECYFWILGVYFEPCYSRARMMTAKIIAIFSIMDDLYDVYGTIDELQMYTDAVQRWSLEDVEQLEECSKLHFLALYSTVQSFQDDLEKEGLSYRVHYLKVAIKEAARAWLEEAKWREEKCVPSLEDHLRVSLITTGYAALACASFVGMIKEMVTKEAFDWVTSFPKIIKATTIICRFMDDVVGHEHETKREHVASTIHCYMKEKGTSIQETCMKLMDTVEDAWKDINEELLNLTTLPTPLLLRILNLARMMETIYRNTDGYTNSAALKETIALLLVLPISF